MREKSILKLIKISSLLFTVNVTGLIFFATIPLIFEDIPINSQYFLTRIYPHVKFAIKDNSNFEIHRNLNSLGISDNVEVSNLVGITNPITICFWGAIIISIIISIALIFSIKNYYPYIYKKIIFLGLIALIINIVLIFFEIRFISQVGSLNNILLTPIIVEDLPIKYFYIPVIISFVSLAVAIIQVPSMISNICKEDQKINKKIISKNQKAVYSFKGINKNGKNDFLKTQKKSNKNLYCKKEPQNNQINPSIIDNKIEDKPTNEQNPYSVDDYKNSIEYNNQTREKYDKIDNISKINKNELIKNSLKENKKNETPIIKVNVRCPKCSIVFSIKKTGNLIKIKCPSCGKEGIVK